MKILLFKQTTDADLYKGLQVCYKDINGAFTKLGVITDYIIDKDGCTNYLINTAMGAYMADELKLIEVEPVNSFDTLKTAVNDNRAFVEVTEDLFYNALGAVPPIYLKNGTFQMGECYTADLYYTFGQRNGKYYGCLCNSNFSLNNF